MKETKFIEQNKHKWDSFERIIRSDLKDPDKISDLYIQLTDDLSFARTFYPNRSVRVYLNNKAQKIFYNIYGNKTQKRKNFIDFWKHELPSIFFYCRKELLLSCIIFTISVIIGVISSANDTGFSRAILGNEYVDMTIENIDKGDPMAVYKSMKETTMFLGITYNNIMVAFYTFIFGIILAIGSVAIILKNGIMVGTFQYFFIERGLFWESFLSIWLHGTLEISAIIIAGGAGMVLGKGLVFPGSYSRLHAFRISAMQGLKVFMGIVPIIIMAAFIESYLTRYTDLPDAFKGFLIFASLAFVVMYFIVYPYSKYKNGTLKPQDIKLTPQTPRPLLYQGRIKNIGEIFKDVFSIVGKLFGKLVIGNILLAFFYVPSVLLLLYHSLSYGFSTDIWLQHNFPLMFKYADQPALFIVNSVVFALAIHLVFYFIKREDTVFSLGDFKAVKKVYLHRSFLATIFFTVLLNGVFFIEGLWPVIIFVLACPLFLLILFVAFKEKVSIVGATSRAFHLLNDCVLKLYGYTLIMCILGGISYILITSPFILFYYQVLQLNLPVDDNLLQITFYVFNILLTQFCLSLLIILLSGGVGLLYFTFREINEAVSIKERILKIKM